MISNDRPKYRGWALIVLGASVLALGGCGRKGPLDLPPTASSSQPAAAVQNNAEADQTSRPGTVNQNSGLLFSPNPDPGPTAGRGPKRSFVLDPLLNSN